VQLPKALQGAGCRIDSVLIPHGKRVSDPAIESGARGACCRPCRPSSSPSARGGRVAAHRLRRIRRTEGALGSRGAVRRQPAGRHRGPDLWPTGTVLRFNGGQTADGAASVAFSIEPDPAEEPAKPEEPPPAAEPAISAEPGTEPSAGAPATDDPPSPGPGCADRAGAARGGRARRARTLPGASAGFAHADRVSPPDRGRRPGLVLDRAARERASVRRRRAIGSRVSRSSAVVPPPGRRRAGADAPGGAGGRHRLALRPAGWPRSCAISGERRARRRRASRRLPVIHFVLDAQLLAHAPGVRWRHAGLAGSTSRPPRSRSGGRNPA